ncbi:hypothetical protein HK096_006377, partial [Nowakowskiella sp. JEL0078]
MQIRSASVQSLQSRTSPRRVPRDSFYRIFLPSSILIPASLAAEFRREKMRGRAVLFLPHMITAPLIGPNKIDEAMIIVSSSIKSTSILDCCRIECLSENATTGETFTFNSDGEIELVVLDIRLTKGALVFDSVCKAIIHQSKIWGEKARDVDPRYIKINSKLKPESTEGSYNSQEDDQVEVNVELSIALTIRTLMLILDKDVQTVQDEETNFFLDQSQMDQNVANLANLYRKTTARYNTTSVENTFIKAFTTVVNSTQYSTLFDTVLQLERTYSQAAEEAWNRSEKLILDLQQRHAAEIHAVVDNSPALSSRFNSSLSLDKLSFQYPETVSDVSRRQLEEIEIIRATLDSEIEQLHMNQKAEYRDFIIQVHEEMQRRQSDPNATSEDSGPDSESIRGISPSPTIIRLEETINRTPSVNSATFGNILSLKSKQSPQLNSHNNGNLIPNPYLSRKFANSGSSITSVKEETSVVNEASQDPAIAKALQKTPDLNPLLSLMESQTLIYSTLNLKFEDNQNQMIRGIQDMGFTTEQARASLEISLWKLDDALLLLLENPDQVTKYLNRLNSQASGK